MIGITLDYDLIKNLHKIKYISFDAIYKGNTAEIVKVKKKSKKIFLFY